MNTTPLRISRQLHLEARTVADWLRKPLQIAALTTILALSAGCKKTESAMAVPAGTGAAQSSSPAHSTPASLPAVSSSPAAVEAGNGVAVSATTGTGSEWALHQEEIKNDPGGQWAIAATASSCFSDCATRDGNSSFQATGGPNVDQEGDNDEAWSPKEQDAGIEWLDLTFPTPVFAEAIRVRESFNPGAIIKVELYDDHDQLHLLWSGSDPTTGLNYFQLTFPKTSFRTNRLKITLATNLIAGFNEVDAVQLVGAGG